MLLGSCAGDPAPAPPASPAEQPRPVFIGANQTFDLRPGADGRIPPQLIGRLSYTSAGDDRIEFALSTGNAGNFSIDSQGQISLINAIESADLPMSVTVEARIGQNGPPASSAALVFYALDGAPVVNFAPDQSFAINTATAPGNVFGQIAFSASRLRGEPHFVLTGANAADYAVDSEGGLAVAPGARLEPSAGAVIGVTAYSDARRADQIGITSITIAVADASAGAGAAIVIDSIGAARHSLPIAAGAHLATVSATVSGLPAAANAVLSYRIVAGGASGLFSIDDSGRLTAADDFPSVAMIYPLRVLVSARAGAANPSELADFSIVAEIPANPAFESAQYRASNTEFTVSETSAPGLCLIAFAPVRPDSGCAVSAAAIGDDGASGYRYSVANLDTGVYQLSGSRLTLKRPPGYPADGFLVFALTASRQGRQASATARIQMTPPSLDFAASPYLFTDVPVDLAAGDEIGSVRATGAHSAAGMEPRYAITAGNDDNRFAIDASSGAISYDSGQMPSVGERVELVVSASRAGSSATAPVTISFAPGIRFDDPALSVAVNRQINFPDTRIAQAAVTTIPADLELSYRIEGADADKFRIDGKGAVYLERALAEGAAATVVAHNNGTRASIPLTATITEADFLAHAAVTGSAGGRLVYFSAVTPSAARVSGYQWDFGDGNTGAGANAAHLYASAGDYTASLEMTMADGGMETVSHTVSPFASADPLAPLQWYLAQPAPSPFFYRAGGDGAPAVFLDHLSRPVGKAGEDIRAPDPLRVCGVLDSCRGEGVIVRVVDSGFQSSHPDLAGNLSRERSWNFNTGVIGLGGEAYIDPGVSIGDLVTTGEAHSIVVRVSLDRAHGTNVAGIIGARDNNGIGGRGVSPRATLTNYNFTIGQSDETEIQSHQTGGADSLLRADVVNHSYGRGGHTRAYLRMAAVSFDALSATLAANEGRGVVNVKAAGNFGFPELEDIDKFGNRQAAGLEHFNAVHGVITVSSVYPNGEADRSSDVGDNIVVAAYNGPPECLNPVDYRIRTGIANPIGIVTTGLVGDRGRLWRPPADLFELPLDGGPLRRFMYPDDIQDYAFCFGGTSSAAPMVSGTAALMIQARPALGWRDARAILAETARHNAPDDPGWAVNGADYDYNPKFGFGVLDSRRALALARSWTLLGEQMVYESAQLDPDSPVADCAGAGCDPGSPASVGIATSFSHSPAVDFDTLETAQVELRVEFSYPDGSAAVSTRGTIEIALEHSDSRGQLLSRSVLHKLHPAYRGYSASTDQESGFPALVAIDWTYLSLRHFGESPGGLWRLVITDHDDDGAEIVLKHWRLRLRGY